MRARLRALQAEQYDVIGDVRGRGAMIAIELVTARHHRARRRRSPARSPRPATRQGVVVLTCGTYGNVLRFLPPLAISDELLDEALDVLEEAFASVAAG